MLAASLSTTVLLGNLFHRMFADPAFEALLRAQHSLIPLAVEESLRLEPPVMHLFRTQTVDRTVAGTAISRGERIVLGIASANRDETVYGADAESFRPDRTPDQEHLAFGAGPHTCPGKNVARMEARVVLETYFDTYPQGTLRLAPDFVFEFVPMYLEYGPRRLDVVVDHAVYRAATDPHGVVPT